MWFSIKQLQPYATESSAGEHGSASGGFTPYCAGGDAVIIRSQGIVGFPGLHGHGVVGEAEQHFKSAGRVADGVAAQVQQQFRLDPRQQAVFLFCGKRSDRFKALFWDGDGFVLLYKRLENGRYQWPRTREEVQQLTPQQYRWLMEGLSIVQPKAHKNVSAKDLV
jgi:transposase